MQARTPTSAQGIDVSYAQGTVSWAKVRAAGIDFAYARATQGTTIHDSQFARNWPNIRAHGLMRGAYHFAVPGTVLEDARRQAAWFVHAVKEAGGYQTGDLPPVLDLEENPNHLAPGPLANWALTWLTAVDAALGTHSMVYGPWSFLSALPRGALADRRLWIAWPDTGSIPGNLPNWTEWTCMQYTFHGDVPGISGAVDRDAWCLPAAGLAREVGFTTSPTPTGPKVVLAQSPILQPIAQQLAKEYGWQATSSLDAIKGAAAVVCVGGTSEFIDQAKAAAGSAWHTPLAGSNLWLTLQLVAQAGLTGKF